MVAAKKEGKLVLASGPSPEARVRVPEAFKKRFGVDVEYLGGATSDLANRVRSEQAAGQYTVDVVIAGADTSYLVLHREQLIEPVRPHLIHPEALEPAAWKNGKVWFTDPEEQSIVRVSNQASLGIVVNPEFVQPDELTSWYDLLKPPYKGRIAAYDPTQSGNGGQRGAYLYNTLGAEFVKRLYIDQNVALTLDRRVMSNWLARGTYHIAISLGAEELDSLTSDGFKLRVVPPLPEAPGTLSAGFGLMSLMKNPPHPNAAKVFLNWMLMREGQTAYNSATRTVSVRSDVDSSSWASPHTIPKPGVNYFDTYAWEYTTTSWPKANQAIKAMYAEKK